MHVCVSGCGRRVLVHRLSTAWVRFRCWARVEKALEKIVADGEKGIGRYLTRMMRGQAEKRGRQRLVGSSPQLVFGFQHWVIEFKDN